jgi:phosphate-selective porin OprO/OprP
VLHNTVAITRINNGNHEWLANPEFVLQYGPFLIQSEYNACWVNGVTNFTTPTQSNVAVPSQLYFSQGAYVEVLYFLTGDHRDYNPRQGVFGRVLPLRNFFFVPTENCCTAWSAGAWQVGARYSWLDLDDNNIHGGTLHDVTLGLNWFLNPNSKIQWNVEYLRREITGGTSSGDIYGAGVRFAFDF